MSVNKTRCFGKMRGSTAYKPKEPACVLARRVVSGQKFVHQPILLLLGAFVSIVPVSAIVATMMGTNSYTPAQTIEMVSRAGVYKGNMRPEKIFLSSVSAGCLLGFACATALSINSSPWYQENAPGLIKAIAALVFPYGLCMIVLTGADLCTGTFMARLLCSSWSAIPFADSYRSIRLSQSFTEDCPLQRCLCTGPSRWYVTIKFECDIYIVLRGGSLVTLLDLCSLFPLSSAVSHCPLATIVC